MIYVRVCSPRVCEDPKKGHTGKWGHGLGLCLRPPGREAVPTPRPRCVRGPAVALPMVSCILVTGTQDLTAPCLPAVPMGTRTQDLTVPCIPGCAPGPATVPFLMCLGCVQGLSFAEGPCLSGQGSRIGSQIPGLMSDLHAQLPGLWRSVGPALWSMLAHFPVHIGRCAGGISVVGRLEEAARGVPAR